MKTFGLAGAVLVAACGIAHSQEAQQRYQGTFFVTKAQNCENADGTPAATEGDNFTFVFRTETSRQAMAIIGQRRALAFVPNTPRFGKAGDLVGTYIPSSAVPRSAPGKYAAFKFTPSQIAADTPAIRLAGKIIDFEGLSGCEVTFEAGGTRRPGF